MNLNVGEKYTLTFRSTASGFNFTINQWLHNKLTAVLGSRVHVLKVQLFGDIKVTVIVNKPYNAHALVDTITRVISDYEGETFIFTGYENEVGDLVNITAPVVDVARNFTIATLPLLLTFILLIYVAKN